MPPNTIPPRRTSPEMRQLKLSWPLSRDPAPAPAPAPAPSAASASAHTGGRSLLARQARTSVPAAAAAPATPPDPADSSFVSTATNTSGATTSSIDVDLYYRESMSIPPTDSCDGTGPLIQYPVLDRDRHYNHDSPSADEDVFSDAWSSLSSAEHLPIGDEEDGRYDFGTSGPAAAPQPPSPALSAADSYDDFPELEAVRDDDVTGELIGFDFPVLTQKSPPAGAGAASASAAATATAITAALELQLSQMVLGPPPPYTPSRPRPASLEARLGLVWPILPPGLRNAPLAVIWEVTRAAVHCSVDLDGTDLRYDPTWQAQTHLRSALRRHPAFEGKSLPDRSDPRAWRAAVQTNFGSGYDAVVLAAVVATCKPKSTASTPLGACPIRLEELCPLRLEQSCRLRRRFGPDRFLELLFPSRTSWNETLKADGRGEEIVSRWLANVTHPFLGRKWAAFWTKDAGKATAPWSKPFSLEPESRPIYQDRIYLFAEDGIGFADGGGGPLPPPEETVELRTRCGRNLMLNWLLGFADNREQKHLKLFSRIALGLSKTMPAYVLEERQIKHREKDILSATGRVMNDGIGLASVGLMLRVRDQLGLPDVPAAIQARLGSAKGLWIVDSRRGGGGGDDDDDAIWIETYPSQRKWICNWSEPHHRTLEIRSWSSELRSASLNLQFLPILEDRASDRARMRACLGAFLEAELRRDLDSLRVALARPDQLRLWVQANATRPSSDGSNGGRGKDGDSSSAWLGGLPDRDEDVMALLIDGGFAPTEQRFLWDLIVRSQDRKCQRLRQKMNIRIGQSAYVYMVVDFSGTLAEGEIHLSFSSRFREDDGGGGGGGGGDDFFSDTILHGREVLVGRAPAHLPSDIQKVRAVFRPELHHLKDVVVFSIRGDTPLADKLSGGDYDGDRAWVCWDPRIVANFEPVVDVPPEPPNLSRFYDADETTLQNLEELLQPGRDAIDDMVYEGFAFNIQPSMLGQCTNWKERFCYQRNCVSDGPAILLASLLSRLVDQPKQGIVFGKSHFERLCAELGEPNRLPEPPYRRAIAENKGTEAATEQQERQQQQQEHTHIINHLLFDVAERTIEAEMARLRTLFRPEGLDGNETRPMYRDRDLESVAKRFQELVDSLHGRAANLGPLLNGLQAEIDACVKAWRGLTAAIGYGAKGSYNDYSHAVVPVHAMWRSIGVDSVLAKLPAAKAVPPEVAQLLRGLAAPGGDLSQWELLKASVTFRNYHNRAPRFAWRMAGRQLQFIKATVRAGRQQPALWGRAENGKQNEADSGDDECDDEKTVTTSSQTPVGVIPEIYRALRPDGRLIRQLAARRERGSDGEWSDGEEEEEE